jgi:DNA-binding CsgD family transcriptional regulator
MHTVFYGWRRKAGVVTLVMACLVMGTWVRGFASSDQICLSPFSIISIRDKIAAIRNAQTIMPGARIFTTRSVSLVGNFKPDAYGNCPVWWDTQEVSERSDFAGHHLARSHVPEGSPSIEIDFPHLSVVIPLTLLSAYLIFRKPKMELSVLKTNQQLERWKNLRSREDRWRQYGLTPQERDVLLLVARGFSIRDIACELNTGDDHANAIQRSLLNKLDVGDHPSLIRKAKGE